MSVKPTSTGSSQGGIEVPALGMGSPMVRRPVAVLLALSLALAGCGQGGSPEIANQAADEFLTALVHGDVSAAWSHLDPGSQRIAYDNDEAAFIRDVNDADWTQLSWQFGPVVNLDYAWEVHVVADETAVPDFLVERAIAGWADPWFVMQVKTPAGQPYLIVAEER
jgi:hypothetical protein